MNNLELARLIVNDVMNKVNAGEQVFYMEYVRSVEALLNKHAAQHSVHLTGLTARAWKVRLLFPLPLKSVRSAINAPQVKQTVSCLLCQRKVI